MLGLLLSKSVGSFAAALSPLGLVDTQGVELLKTPPQEVRLQV